MHNSTYRSHIVLYYFTSPTYPSNACNLALLTEFAVLSSPHLRGWLTVQQCLQLSQRIGSTRDADFIFPRVSHKFWDSHWRRQQWWHRGCSLTRLRGRNGRDRWSLPHGLFETHTRGLSGFCTIIVFISRLKMIKQWIPSVGAMKKSWAKVVSDPMQAVLTNSYFSFL